MKPETLPADKEREKGRQAVTDNLPAELVSKRRQALVTLLAEYRRPVEICRELSITLPEFNRMMRETQGLADEVNATIQAMHLGLRGRVVKMREEVLEGSEDDGHRLEAGRDIDHAAGVTYARVDGVPSIVIMGQELNVQTAKAHDLEEIMREAAKRTGKPEVVKYVEGKITGKDKGEENA